MTKFLKEQYTFVISLILFCMILFTHTEFYKAIILMLEFIVILEVFKMISDFLEKSRLSLRYIIDVFIVFLIRDVVILVTKPILDYHRIVFMLCVIFVFFMFRFFSLKFSPTVYKKKNNK